MEKKDESTSDERRKEVVQELARLYFKQYLTATQAEDIPKSIVCIEKQTACQIEISGDQSTNVCSNLFLMAHLQIKLGRYTDAQVNNGKVIGMSEALREDFGDDYAIVASKFYLQQAKLAFITRHNQDAKTAVEKGLLLIVDV